MKAILITFFIFFIYDLPFAQNDSLKIPPPATKKNTKKRGYDKIQLAASFPGGDSAYIRFITTNLQTIADSAGALGVRKNTCKVDLTFIIDEEGHVKAYEVESSPKEFFLEAACTNMIQRSPRWTVAMQNDRLVKEFRRQLLTIVVE
jgi:hypothetical protein